MNNQRQGLVWPELSLNSWSSCSTSQMLASQACGPHLLEILACFVPPLSHMCDAGSLGASIHSLSGGFLLILPCLVFYFIKISVEYDDRLVFITLCIAQADFQLLVSAILHLMLSKEVDTFMNHFSVFSLLL